MSKRFVSWEWFERLVEAIVWHEGTHEPSGVFRPVARKILEDVGIIVEAKEKA